jgi:beta-1,4-N-acetylglucosaminyltransferase
MKKIGLVTSKGGHLFQLSLVQELWNEYECFWVTFKGKDSESLLKNEKIYFAHYPESRNIFNALKNFFLALKVLKYEQPDVVISAGAGIAPPFFLACKLLNIKTIFIEPFDFIAFPSLSGQICYRITNHFLVQHKKQLQFYPRATYVGSLL